MLSVLIRAGARGCRGEVHSVFQSWTAVPWLLLSFELRHQVGVLLVELARLFQHRVQRIVVAGEELLQRLVVIFFGLFVVRRSIRLAPELQVREAPWRV